MKSITLFVLALACLATARTDTTWKKIVSKQGKVSFAMSWTPTLSVEENENYKVQQYRLVQWDNAYEVKAAKMTAISQMAVKQTDKGPGLYSKRFILDQLVNGFVGATRLKPLEDSYFKFQGQLARKTRLVTKDGRLIRTIGVITKTHLYLFLASYPKNDPAQGDYKRFFDSIQLMP